MRSRSAMNRESQENRLDRTLTFPDSTADSKTVRIDRDSMAINGETSDVLAASGSMR
jgi:hypothetical protein